MSQNKLKPMNELKRFHRGLLGLINRIKQKNLGLTKLIHAYDNAGGRTWSRMAEHINELLTTSVITVVGYSQRSGLKDCWQMRANQSELIQKKPCKGLF